MALNIAVSLMAASPLLLAHLLIRPSAQRERRNRARTEAHRRFEELEAAEAQLYRRINAP
jgi:hypothetical protein